MTIKINFCHNIGIFYIEYNDATMLTDGDRLDLDDYVELVFNSNQPFHYEVYSNEHDFVRYDYSVMIHQSLIHNGENETAIFSTTSRQVYERILQLQPGKRIPIRARRGKHCYDLDFEPFRKGLRIYDPPRNA